jgi:3-deoxy-manno-octulosonate cytidylyltransferase (CMP-KDO synthetase)
MGVDGHMSIPTLDQAYTKGYKDNQVRWIQEWLVLNDCETSIDARFGPARYQSLHFLNSICYSSFLLCSENRLGIPMSALHISGIIPARYSSSRYPGKPLAPLGDKTMIQHVYDRCLLSDTLDDVYVATDDERIQKAVEAFGGKVIMTRADHPSGTDRLAEATEKIDTDIIVNIQGDQPFFDPDMVLEGVQPLLDDPSLELCTLMAAIGDKSDHLDTGFVKTVCNLQGDALYFSRSLIPYPHTNTPHGVYEHLGLYVYTKAMLIKLAALPPTILEQVESLEQLRWLEHGIRIRVVETQCTDQAFSGFSIDTLEDLQRGEAMLKERGL